MSYLATGECIDLGPLRRLRARPLGFIPTAPTATQAAMAGVGLLLAFYLLRRK